MHTKRLNCASRTWPGRVIISALVIGCWLSAAAAEQGLVRIDVTIGKSQVIEVKERFDRVSVTDPNIADVFVVTPNQILINGKAVGVTSLVVFYPKKTLFFDLVVQTDIALLQERLKQIAPRDEIEVRPAQNAIILHGAVTSDDLVSSAGEVASVFTPKGRVINLLTVRDVKPQEVMIQVQVAEVLRSALRELGFSARFLGSTFQGAFFPGTPFFPPLGLIGAAASVVDSPTIQSPEMQFTDLANLFFASPDRDFAGLVRALAERDLLRVLAKPNLVTESGKKASFLSGGEFPFPVAQAGAAAGAITIEFKPFGVSLTFLPVLMDGNRINLAVQPEVSSLDFSQGLVSAGFQVPTIRKTMASTTVNLKDGESFAIAGLINNEIRQAVAKVPLLGDIPILGALFRSVRFRNNESELLFLVTVKLVKGVPPGDPRVPDPTKLMEMREEDKSEFTLLPGIPGVGEVVERPLGRSDL